MKTLVKWLAIFVVGVASVVVAQRLIRKLYTSLGKKYIVIEDRQGA